MSNALQPDEVLVYVVDDDVSVTDSLATLLESQGMRAEAFASGRALIDSLAVAIPAVPACILLDLHMPELDGAAALRWIRDHGCAIPVIMMTGRGVADGARRFREMGAVGYLTKPISKNGLLAAIRNAIPA